MYRCAGSRAADVPNQSLLLDGSQRPAEAPSSPRLGTHAHFRVPGHRPSLSQWPTSPPRASADATVEVRALGLILVVAVPRYLRLSDGQALVTLGGYDALVDETGVISAILQNLQGNKDVVGVIVFGSLARSELTPSSDIDVLVVHEPEASAEDLREWIQQVAAEQKLPYRVTPVFFTREALLREFDKHPSFAAHLSDEGVVIPVRPEFDIVKQILQSPPARAALDRELSNCIRELKLFSDLDRFNSEFVPCLAQLYSLGRSIVIVKLLEHDVHEYNWRRLFDTYSKIRPDLNDDLNRVEELRSYYEHIQNRMDLPRDYRSVDKRYVGDAIESIATVADS